MENKNTKTIRNLKVYTRFNETGFSKNPFLPEIRLKGIWLKEWGFTCGNEIHIVKTKYGIAIMNKEYEIPVIRL